MFLAERRQQLDRVIELCVEEDALVERLIGRLTYAACGKSYYDRFKLPRMDGACTTCGALEPKRRYHGNEVTVRTGMAEYPTRPASILTLL